MRPYFLGLSTLVVFLKVAECSYEPWEELKTRWYADFDYNREEAEARQSETVNNCTSTTGANGGLCFDDCMLRIQYRLLNFHWGEDYEPQYQYYVNPQGGLKNFEQIVLKLQQNDKEEITDDDPARNETLYQRLSSCKTRISE